MMIKHIEPIKNKKRILTVNNNEHVPLIGLILLREVADQVKDNPKRIDEEIIFEALCESLEKK